MGSRPFKGYYWWSRSFSCHCYDNTLPIETWIIHFRKKVNVYLWQCNCANNGIFIGWCFIAPPSFASFCLQQHNLPSPLNLIPIHPRCLILWCPRICCHLTWRRWHFKNIVYQFVETNRKYVLHCSALRYQRRQLRNQTNELRSPPGRLARARNQKDE